MLGEGEGGRRELRQKASRAGRTERSQLAVPASTIARTHPSYTLPPRLSNPSNPASLESLNLPLSHLQALFNLLPPRTDLQLLHRLLWRQEPRLNADIVVGRSESARIGPRAGGPVPFCDDRWWRRGSDGTAREEVVRWEGGDGCWLVKDWEGHTPGRRALRARHGGWCGRGEKGTDRWRFLRWDCCAVVGLPQGELSGLLARCIDLLRKT